MQEIVKIGQDNIGGMSIQTVNARELHSFLEVGKDFSNWMKDRIESFGFTENQDFVVFAVSGEKGRPSKEYHLSIDMAKELSMVERNEKGKQARLYFIECERRAKCIDPVAALNDPATMRSLLLTYTEKVLVLQPKADAHDRLCGAEGMVCIRDAAKALKLPQSKLVAWLLVNKWMYRDGKGKLRGYADKTPRYVIHKITAIPKDGDEDRVSLQAMITAEGLTRLAAKLNVELETAA